LLPTNPLSDDDILHGTQAQTRDALLPKLISGEVRVEYVEERERLK